MSKKKEPAPQAQRRIRLTDGSLNSYGFRVLTEGIDLTLYESNPVLLYMHERGNIIGLLQDIQVEDGALTAEPVFDEASEQSRVCKRQYEFGSLRMCSVSLEILGTSEAAEDLIPGQTRPTVTRSRLMEVSLVDIGANPNSIRLTKNGKQIELSDGADCALPLLDPIINPQTSTAMTEQERIALALAMGLKETATVAEIQSKAAELKATSDGAASMEAELARQQSAAVERVVLAAIAQKKIGEEKKQQFIDLGAKVGADELQKTLDAFSPQVRLSDIVGGGSGATPTQKKWSDLTESELKSLRSDNPTEYKRLYEQHYGRACVLEP